MGVLEWCWCGEFVVFHSSIVSVRLIRWSSEKKMMDDRWIEDMWDELPEIGDNGGSLESISSIDRQLKESALERALWNENNEEEGPSHILEMVDDPVGDERHQTSGVAAELETRTKAAVKEAMEEIKEDWIDEPPIERVSTRELRRWRNHLVFVDDVMKEHAKRRSSENVLRAVYRYAEQGHTVYRGTLETVARDEEATAHEKDEAQRMLGRYDGGRTLKKYLEKGLKRLKDDQLEWMSGTTSMTSARSSCKVESLQARVILEEERKKHQDEMARMREQMEEEQRELRQEMRNCLNRETAAYQEEMRFVLSEKKKELERGKSAAQSLMEENRLVRRNLALTERKLMETKHMNTEYARRMEETRDMMLEGQRAMTDTQNQLGKERNLRMQQEKSKAEMEEELMETRRRYKKLEEQKLFPDAEIFNREERKEHGHGVSGIRRQIKQDITWDSRGRQYTDGQGVDLEWDDIFGSRKTEVGTKPREQRDGGRSQKVEIGRGQDQRWSALQQEVDEDRSSGTFNLSEQRRGRWSLEEDDERKQDQRWSKLSRAAEEERSSLTFNVKDKRPWLNKGNTINKRMGYGNTELDRAQFLSLIEAMKTTQASRFGGKSIEFPAFRQRIRPYFNMYFDSAPLLLLEYMLASITKDVAKDVAYNAQREDPQEALIRIWENLDRLYGNEQEILTELFKGVSRPSRSLKSDYKDLQNYWLRLDECRVVLTGMDKGYLLKKGKLLMKLVNGFNHDLKSKFELRYPDPDVWNYQCVMDHVNNEIKYLKKLRGHTEDQAIDRMDERKERRWTPTNKMNPLEVTSGARDYEQQKSMTYCAMHRNGMHDTGDCSKWNELEVDDRRNRCKLYGLCYRCLGKHLRIHCTSNHNCEVCGREHHTSLHSGKEDSKQGIGKETIQAATRHEEEEDDERQVPIIALSAYIGKKKRLNCYAFLDCAAEKTMGSKELAQDMEIWDPDGTTTLCSLTGRKKVRSMTSPVTLRNQHGAEAVLDNVIFAQDVTFPFSQNIPSKSLLAHYKGTEQGKFPAFKKRQIDMVIGMVGNENSNYCSRVVGVWPRMVGQ